MVKLFWGFISVSTWLESYINRMIIYKYSLNMMVGEGGEVKEHDAGTLRKILAKNSAAIYSSSTNNYLLNNLLQVVILKSRWKCFKMSSFHIFTV